LCSVGLALSVYLALLKFFALPCVGPGNCHAIIHSQYGTVIGLPVGVYSALLWSAAILVDDRTKRGALLTLLSLGAVIFITIQFAVLRGFCLYCTLHALTAWTALAFHASSPRRWALPLGLVLAGVGFWATRQHVIAHVQSTPPASASAVLHNELPLARSPARVTWLGEPAATSPAVVISLNCAACLDLLDELTRLHYRDDAPGPAMFFKVTDENRELTKQFVAAVLAQPGSKREAFLTATTVLLGHKDAALSGPNVAAAEIGAIFPAAAQKADEASKLLVLQTDALHHAALADTTPLLVPSNGAPSAFFKVEELFKSSPAK
jgi:uncharacterized membrane protein